MIKKSFLVEIANLVILPYEESLMDGLVNKNHLMYLAQAELDKRGFSSSKAIYYYTLREDDTEGKTKDIEL